MPNDPQPAKICILSVAASGKSTFRREHPEYRGCLVVDVAQLMPKPRLLTKLLLYLGRIVPPVKKITACTPSQKAKRPERYYPMLKSYLHAQQKGSILLANRGPTPASEFEGVSLAAVLIPIEDHQRNCKSRLTEMRNPVPFLHHASTDFANVRKMRERLESYAREYRIPVFESYREAIDSLLDQPSP